MRFTDRYIKSLKAKEQRYERREESSHGLGSLVIRVSTAGTKTWNYSFKFDRKAQRLTLGTYPKMSLNDAHIAQANAANLVQQGINPGTITVEERKAEREAPTVAGLAKEFMEKWSEPDKKSWPEDQRIINYDIVPAWGSRKAHSLTKKDIHKWLDEKKKIAPVQANRTFALIRKMFNFAVERDILPSNPCTGISAPTKESQRDRFLSLEEIEVVLAKLPKAKMTKLTRLALIFQLLTAQRSGEVAAMAWSDVDIDSKWWTIPARKAKNNLLHRVPLSEQAIEVLNQIKTLQALTAPKKEKTLQKHKERNKPINGRAYSLWVFPSPQWKNGDNHMTNEAVCRAISENESLFGIAPFTPHDLRRTGPSNMTSMGITVHVVSKILNHADHSVTAVYDRNSYDREKREALDRWGQTIKPMLVYTYIEETKNM